MEYLEIGKLIATAIIFTYIGWSLNKTKTNKRLLENSEVFERIIRDLQDTVIDEIHTSKHERGKMLMNQVEIDKMIKENKELNKQILNSMKGKKVSVENNEAENELNSIKKDKRT